MEFHQARYLLALAKSLNRDSSTAEVRSQFPAVIATSAAFFMIVLDTAIVNLALPRSKDVFQADLISLQWLVDGYALVFASLLLNAGALGDRYGAKRVFTSGLSLFCVASAACGLAPSLASLQFARAVQGVGAALLLPNSLAALNHTVEDPDRRKAAVAAWSTAGALGVAFGPLVGGILVQCLDRRSIFPVNVPVGLVALWLARRHVAAGSRHAHRRQASRSSPASSLAWRRCKASSSRRQLPLQATAVKPPSHNLSNSLLQVTEGPHFNLR
jgi:DHA2 family methylenomycin A resistance protein-like MFS transporter